MLILKRIIHNTIWGGSRLSQYAGVAGNDIGHLYSLYCRKGVSNEILNGVWKGRFLNDVFPLFKSDFHLSAYDYFPLTLALTEANENLSIQVHPTDKAAMELENKARGKRESWYFIEAPTSGLIINGCTCRDREQMKQMIARGEFLQLADTLPVSVGDYVFVEPGTLHSITAGSLVFEIEEGSDYTYRFYDYDRTDSQGNKRELHLEKAVSTLDVDLKSTVKSYHGQEIKEKTYSTKLISHTESYSNESGTLECFTFVKGALSCEGMQIAPGTTILLWPDEQIDTRRVEMAFVSKTEEGKI